MAVYDGSFKQVALTKETPRGTYVAPSSGDWQATLGSATEFRPVIEKAKSEMGMGHIATDLNSNIIKQYSQGSIPLAMNIEFLGHIFNMVFGQSPTTSGTGPYTHSWTLANNNQHTTYSVTIQDPQKGGLGYSTGLANEATLEFTTDDICKATLAMIAKNETTQSVTPAYDTDQIDNFLPSHLTVKLADNLGGLDAASAIEVSNVSLTVAKNVDAWFVLGSKNPADIINQKMAITGTIEMLYDATTLRDLAMSDTKKALRVAGDNGDGVTFEFDIARVGFEDWSDDTDLNAFQKNTVNFYSELDMTNGLVVAELVNSVSSY